MKLRFGWLSRVGSGLFLIVILLSAMTVLAQSADQTVRTIFGGIFLLFILVVILAVYIYIALGTAYNCGEDGHAK